MRAKPGSGPGTGALTTALIICGLFCIAAASAEVTATVTVTGTAMTATEWMSMAGNYTNQGRYDGALYAYDRAIEANPHYARAYFQKGQVLATINRHEDAIKAFEMAITTDPGLKGVVDPFLQTSVSIVYPDIPSGSLLSGGWSAVWKYLIINNQQGLSDVVVALTPPGSDASASTAVYVKKGYTHTFPRLVPQGTYEFYITSGERWNVQRKVFDKDARYMKWDATRNFGGTGGNGYIMTFIPQNYYYPSWYVQNLDSIPQTEFPKI